MRQRIPIIYLVDSAGVNLPYQGGVFPGQYGAARIFYYNSIMRRYLHVPQISAVMGSCIAGGAYLPALSDVIFMVEGTSFMGLGGPNLVKGATGQTIDAETLGGAVTHTELSAVAHYRAANDADCLARIREYVGAAAPDRTACGTACGPPRPPARPPDRRSTTSCRRITGCPTTCATCSRCMLDGGALDEFQPDVAREMICGHAHIEGWPVAVIANQRGVIKGQPRRAAPLRRHRLHRERGEGGLLHRDRQPRAAAHPLRPGRERLHGRPRGGARRDHPGRRPLRRGDGHGGGAQDRAHREPRLRRRLLRHGGAGIRSRLHPLLAHRPHGRDGRRVGGHGGARARDRAGPARGARALAPRSRRRWTRCGPTTSSSSTPVRRRARLRGRHRHARRDPRPARLRPARSPPTTPGRISVPSCFRRSTRPPPARSRMRPSRLSALPLLAARARLRRPASQSPSRRPRPPTPDQPRRRAATSIRGRAPPARRPTRRTGTAAGRTRDSGPAGGAARGGLRPRLDAARQHRRRRLPAGAPDVSTAAAC